MRKNIKVLLAKAEEVVAKWKEGDVGNDVELDRAVLNLRDAIEHVKGES